MPLRLTASTAEGKSDVASTVKSGSIRKNAAMASRTSSWSSAINIFILILNTGTCLESFVQIYATNASHGKQSLWCGNDCCPW